jgi:hypothetical protein
MIDAQESAVLGAGLISAAQRVEHYEIAAYGCVRTYANLLGETDAAKFVNQTLEEEKETDKSSTTLAEKINAEASKKKARKSPNRPVRNVKRQKRNGEEKIPRRRRTRNRATVHWRHLSRFPWAVSLCG